MFEVMLQLVYIAALFQKDCSENSGCMSTEPMQGQRLGQGQIAQRLHTYTTASSKQH
jgi:hypothetical protein